jgi:hypothetical protein
MRAFILSALLYCFALSLSAQTIQVTDIDVTGYPTISARILISDRDGNSIRPSQPSELSLSVNSVPVPVKTIDCPPPAEKLPVHAVLVNDRSQSMQEPITGTVDDLRINLVMLGSSTFILTLDFSVPNTKIAMTAFDTTAYLMTGFTDFMPTLSAQAGALRPASFPGTNYNAAFLHPTAGAIPLLKTAPAGVERIIVFLTDGDPTEPFQIAKVISEAVANRIKVYPVTLDLPMVPYLQQLADATGGLAFSNVRTQAEISRIYGRIARQSQSSTPCIITWTVDPCDPAEVHTAKISYPPLNASATFTYNVKPYLRFSTVSVGRDTTICRGQSIQLRATGNDPAGTYTWYPTTNLSNPTVATPTASPDASTVYTVVFTDSRGCTSSREITVTVLDPAVDIIPDSLMICKGDEVLLEATGNGTTFSWMPVTGLSNPSTSATIARPQQTTTYYLTTRIGACTATDSVTIIVYDPTAGGVSAGRDTSVCFGESVVLHPQMPVGTYVWSPADGLDNPFSQTPTARPAVTTTYHLVVTTATGCTVADSVTVTVHPLPIVDAGNDLRICPEESVTLQATGGTGSYTWSPQEGLDRTDRATVTASPTVTTVYTVLYTDPNGCTAVDSVTVVINNKLSVEAGADKSICPGGTVSLSVTGAEGTYTWTPAAGLDVPTSRTPIASPEKTTTYIVTVVSPQGCIGTDSVTVTVYPGAHIDAGETVYLCEGNSAMLTATRSSGTYLWTPSVGLDNPASRTPIAFPSTTTLYHVTVTDENGCVATDSVLVNIRPQSTITLSLDVPSGTVQFGEDVQVILRADNIDPQRDTITAFTIVISYDPLSLRYRTSSLTAGAAANGWTIIPTDNSQTGLLTLQGSGALLQSGTICSFTLTPYLSQETATEHIAAIRFNNVAVASNDCLSWQTVDTDIIVPDFCSSTLRAVRLGADYALEQNTPNPARDEIQIQYTLGLDAFTRLALYNAYGEEVAVPVNSNQQSGSHTVQMSTSSLPAGVYIYRLTSGPYTAVRQMVIVK